MIRAITTTTVNKIKKYKPHIILGGFMLVFVMLFSSLFVVIIKNNLTIAKSRGIRELEKNNQELESTLKDKLYTFKRLSASENIRSKAISYKMVTPKNQYNIVYVNDSEKKEENELESVFVSISNLFTINEETKAKDDIQ